MEKTIPIKNNYEFLRTYKRGKFFVGKFMTLYVLKNNFQTNRLGITVGKKFGKSVKRNRLKRLIRENYRNYESFLKIGYDMIFVGRSSDIMPDFFAIKKEMKFLLKKMSIFISEIK
jgi:ribonuclease P protein component